jgi:hypothetical protein
VPSFLPLSAKRDNPFHHKHGATNQSPGRTSENFPSRTFVNKGKKRRKGRGGVALALAYPKGLPARGGPLLEEFP